MSSRYFKLVATREGMEEWVVSEFFAGRLRYGWSPPGTDLRNGTRPWEDWPEDIRWSWGQTKFLLLRIRPGDRIVLQTSMPMREFFIGEVTDAGYDFDGSQDDFNHILHIRPLTPKAVPINSALVPEYLKHDLTKRGRYYEVYPERSVQALDELLDRVQQGEVDLTVVRHARALFDETLERSKRRLANEIRDTWPAVNFESFCVELLAGLQHVEVRQHSDSGKGWDLLVRILNPITGEVLVDDIPVQCKNYKNLVIDEQPIDDLQRCAENSDSPLAMLMIMGDLSDEYRQRILERATALSKQLNRSITFQVIDEGRIAELYAASWRADATNTAGGVSSGE